MEFSISLDRTKISDAKSFDLFLSNSSATFKRTLLNRLDYNVCKIYDKQLLRICELIGLDKSIINKDFTYNLLHYSIMKIEHTVTSSGVNLYVVNIPQNNPFGPKMLIDKVLRIIEYGQGEIRPYMIFNSSFSDFKIKLLDRYNKLF